MAEPKTRCLLCDAEILEATAARTGRLCMPCKNGVRRPAAAELIAITCRIYSDSGEALEVILPANVLLEKLATTRHIGDSEHANRYELEAQRALVRHAIRYRVSWTLRDDHWHRTSYACLELFERGQASLLVADRSFSFHEVRKEEWREGTGSLASHGGFLYRDSAGAVLFKRSTWRA